MIRYCSICSSRDKSKAREDGCLDKFGFGMSPDNSAEKEPAESMEIITTSVGKISGFGVLARPVFHFSGI
ncbi:MAG: hypothetical protein CVU06_13070 [Bacteroidetes bacterium HGW-Bacteroidetes-22]|nr:MAG: hypothetical protein CVU06_13070 [Bacteroidetes bacterium HGW-Bacteroidetes-22]